MISGFGYSLFGFLLAIAILVTVHEFGHFWVARKLGVKVLEFSIGFGKSLYRWRRKNDPTQYSIGMIPLGGYVKMLDEREAEVMVEERPQAFNNQPLWARSAVVFAGPGFNFLFAIVAIWAVLLIGSADIKPLIGAVAEQSVADKAGFRSGDLLVAVDGRKIRSWNDQQFYMLHQAMKGNAMRVTVEDNSGASRQITVDFAGLDQAAISASPITAQIGLSPSPPAAVFDRTIDDAPAARAGLQAGDKVIAINDKPIADWFEMVAVVSSSPGQLLRLRIERDGAVFEVELTTEKTAIDGRLYGRIGVYMPPMQNTELKYGLLSGFFAALDYNWRLTAITLRALGRMLTAEMSIDNLSGPITIARFAGDTVESGLVDFLRFLAIISISLGLINLLPIPVLDGGHLLYFLFEALTGRQPSATVMMRGQQLGIFLLVLLMSLAFYNDIMRLI